MFEFDDLCFSSKCLIASAVESNTPHAFLKLNLLLSKYSILKPNESLPIIVGSNIYQDREERMSTLLREKEEAAGWTLRPIKGINPLIVQYRIHLVDNAKPC